MRNTHLLICLLGLVLSALQACQPNSSDPVVPGTPNPTTTTSRFRVKSLTQDLTDKTAKLTVFHYDAQGRLSSLSAYQTPDSMLRPVETCTYRYDAQNRLILQQRQVRTWPSLANATPVLYIPSVSQHQFTYTTNDQIAQIRLSSNSSLLLTPGQTSVDLAQLNLPDALAYVLEATYNTGGQLTSARKTYYKGQPGSFIYTSEYSYTGANLTAMRAVNTINGQDDTPQQYRLAYDEQINPFYGVYVIPPYFGGISDMFLNLNTLSPNNITQIGGVSYRYEYNESKLPTVRHTVADNKVVETLHITYEPY